MTTVFIFLFGLLEHSRPSLRCYASHSGLDGCFPMVHTLTQAVILSPVFPKTGNQVKALYSHQVFLENMAPVNDGKFTFLYSGASSQVVYLGDGVSFTYW